ncbi:MAG: hypothetical protein OXC48_09060, partial [Endozoicomonadaceae bacterium]|nr:hypothetical protein [Endozoicomonadaceae bacterium]
QQPSSKVIYKCDHPGCNKVYIERRDLCRHKSLKHLPCGAEFKDYSGLAVHKRHCHQCQNFAESKKLKTIKATQLTDDKILSAKDKADNTQPEENEPNGLAKQLIQNNDLNTTIEIMLSSQSIENNHSPDESESDNYVSWLIVSCPKLISTITNNLSIIKNFVDNHNYQDAASTFATAKTIISNLNKFFSKFKLIDSSCTKNKNTAKIDIMCNAFRCIEHLTLNSFIDQKCSMSYILQKTEEITKAMYEIFADWQLALQSKNHSAIQPESVVISENEDIENHSAIQYESAGLSENESPDLLISLVRDEDHLLPESEEFISLLSDLDNFLECDIEICSDLSLFQQIDTDILLNSE